MSTIADKLLAVAAAKADIADAIEEKGGTVPTKLAEYGDAIRDLPSGGGDEEPADVEFIDYDGTVLYSYAFEEALALTELPAYSDRPGYGTGYTMVNEGWNHTLADIKRNAQAGIKMTVGCTYTTSDGATRIHVHIEGTTAEDREFGFTVAQTARNKISITWGDPNDTSDDVPSVGSLQHTMRYHTYSTTGDFTITIAPLTAGDKALRMQKSICDYNIKYCRKVMCLEMGYVDQFYGSTARGGPLAYCDNIEYLSIPTTVTESEFGSTAACMNMKSLKALVFPKLSISYPIKAFFFKNCTSLEKVSISASASTIGTDMTSSEKGSSFINCISLPYLSVPDNVTDVGKNTFEGCKNLRTVYWSGAIGLHGYAFNRCMSLEEIKICQDGSGNYGVVGGYDFSGCTSLKRMFGPTTIAAGDTMCFQNCIALESVPELSVVSSNMFSGCISLRRVKVTTTSDIGSSAFRYSGLTELDMSGCPNTVALGGSALDSIPDDLVIIVPNGQLSAWQQATGWTNFASKMVEASA